MPRVPRHFSQQLVDLLRVTAGVPNQLVTGGRGQVDVEAASGEFLGAARIQRFQRDLLHLVTGELIQHRGRHALGLIAVQSQQEHDLLGM